MPRLTRMLAPYILGKRPFRDLLAAGCFFRWGFCLGFVAQVESPDNSAQARF